MHLNISTGMRIQMLKPSGSDEAKHLISWVEHGVYDALKKGYLKTVLFGICNDKGGVDLLEVLKSLRSCVSASPDSIRKSTLHPNRRILWLCPGIYLPLCLWGQWRNGDESVYRIEERSENI